MRGMKDITVMFQESLEDMKAKQNDILTRHQATQDSIMVGFNDLLKQFPVTSEVASKVKASRSEIDTIGRA